MNQQKKFEDEMSERLDRLDKQRARQNKTMWAIGAFAIGFLLLVAVSGCSSAVSRDSAREVPRGEVYQTELGSGARVVVSRDHAFGGHGCLSEIYINGKHSADLKIGDLVAFKVDPGEVRVSMRNTGFLCKKSNDSVRAKLAYGEEKRFRISVNFLGFHSFNTRVGE